MITEVKLLRKSDIGYIKKKSDEALVFNDTIAGRVAEAGDSFIVALFLQILNNMLTPRVPIEIIAELHDVFDEIIEKDTRGALIESVDVIDEILQEVKENIEDTKFHPWLDALVGVLRGIAEGIQIKE